MDAHVCCKRDGKHEVVLLLSILDNIHFDLTPHQCEIHPQCADSVRQTTNDMTSNPHWQHRKDALSCEDKSAALAFHLPDSSWSCFGCQPWPKTTVAGHELSTVQQSLCSGSGFVHCSFPALYSVSWCGCELSANVCVLLCHACLPSLRYLRIDNGVLPNVPAKRTCLLVTWFDR